MLSVGPGACSPSGPFWMSVSLKARATDGVTTARTPSSALISSATLSISAWFSGERRSTRVTPSSSSSTLSMAWPPKRSWYATLSMYTWSSVLR